MKYVINDTPMSVRMKEALDEFNKKGPKEWVDALIRTGALTEAEREQAMERMKRSLLRKQKARRKKTAMKKSA